MGCDIHAYMEYRQPGKDWQSFGGENHLDRNYAVFGELAGVRSAGEPVHAVRGAPEDMAWQANSDYWLFIVEGGDFDKESCSPEKAAQWHSHGCAYKKDLRGENRWIQHPDWHTPSWLTGNEWREVIGDGEYRHEFVAVGAALSSFEAAGFETRVVFWFDN